MIGGGGRGEGAARSIAHQVHELYSSLKIYYLLLFT